MLRYLTLEEHIEECNDCAYYFAAEHKGDANVVMNVNRVLTALRRERNARTGGEVRIMRAFHFIVTGEDL